MNTLDPRKISILWIVITTLLLFSLAGCAKDNAQQAAAHEPPTKVCKRVVILPFVDLGTVFGPNTSVRGPLTRQVFVTDVIAPRGELFMSKTLRQLLRTETDVQWVPSSVPADKILIKSGSRTELIKSLQSIGGRHKADGVMIGYLYAFRDRRGGALGAETPAYVSFEVVLLSVATGRLLWQPKFSETQEPLNQNLFELGKFIQRKGRWVTAREMATQALKEMLKTYPGPASQSKTD